MATLFQWSKEFFSHGIFKSRLKYMYISNISIISPNICIKGIQIHRWFLRFFSRFIRAASTGPIRYSCRTICHVDIHSKGPRRYYHRALRIHFTVLRWELRWVLVTAAPRTRHTWLDIAEIPNIRLALYQDAVRQRWFHPCRKVIP